MTDQPYTDADVEMTARAIFFNDFPEGRTAGMPVDGLMTEYRQNACAVLDALAAAGRLTPAEPVDDIEATGQCCCAGCVGMGPCARADIEDDGRD